MTIPEFTLGSSDFDINGNLTAGNSDRVGELLLSGGFLLLPSDTSFSVAVLPMNEVTRRQLNLLLKRPDQPLSLAFSDVASTALWAAPNAVASGLLSRFSPGPITVVSRASTEIPLQVVDHALGGKNSMIGYRIPSSVIERSVAGTVEYPITTTAVIDPETVRPVTDFATARAFILDRIGLTTFTRWGAISGTIDFDELSTVVRVTADGRVEEVRAGAIPLEEIEACRVSLMTQEQQ